MPGLLAGPRPRSCMPRPGTIRASPPRVRASCLIWIEWVYAGCVCVAPETKLAGGPRWNACGCAPGWPLMPSCRLSWQLRKGAVVLPALAQPDVSGHHTNTLQLVLSLQQAANSGKQPSRAGSSCLPQPLCLSAAPHRHIAPRPGPARRREQTGAPLPGIRVGSALTSS